MKIVKGGVTKAKGFTANGLSCGIKRSGKPDLSLIYSETPAVCAGVFTKNSIKAAPLLISQKNLRNNKAQAIIVNSGNANCFTGRFGKIYAQRTTELIGKLLSISNTDVVVSSTGIIGKPLPYIKIEQSAPKLVAGLNRKGSLKAAKGILTTDLNIKEVAVEINIGNKIVSIGGIAKGAGMVAPNMATMLGFITTDVAISAPLLKQALKRATEISFNRITIDGCLSTNDMVVVMANGQAKNKFITEKNENFNKFTEGLNYLCLTLAQKIILDAEGATKFIVININGAQSEQQAHKAGLAVANSILVKTAAFGSNPNWGRVAAAIGSLEIKKVTEENVKITFSSFSKKKIQINVDLNIGKHSATIFTSDLSYEYVRINGEYN